MPTPIIRAEYEQIDLIRRRFDDQADCARAVLRAVLSHVYDLRAGEWEGEGAEAFFREIDDRITPALERLIHALANAAVTVQAVAAELREAEEAGAARFALSSEGDPGQNGGRNANDAVPVPYIPGEFAFPPTYIQDSDTPITPEEEAMLYDFLWNAMLNEHYGLFVIVMAHYTQSMGRNPTVEELFDIWTLASTQGSDGALRALILQDPGFGVWSFAAALAYLPQAWESSRGNDPEDYARFWESFRTWFQEDGIRFFNEPADVVYAFRDWVEGRGSFIEALLSVGPISGGLLAHLVRNFPTGYITDTFARLVNGGNPGAARRFLSILALADFPPINTLSAQARDWIAANTPPGFMDSIARYTQDFTDTAYAEIRAAQRAAATGQPLTPAMQASLDMADTIQDGLRALPPYEGTIYRGINANIPPGGNPLDYIQGTNNSGGVVTFSDAGMTSFTADPNMSWITNPNNDVIFQVVDNQSGRAIWNVSEHADQYEVLVPGGQVYVLGDPVLIPPDHPWYIPGEDRYIIPMIEVPPSGNST